MILQEPLERLDRRGKPRASGDDPDEQETAKAAAQ